LVYAHV